MNVCLNGTSGTRRTTSCPKDITAAEFRFGANQGHMQAAADSLVAELSTAPPQAVDKVNYSHRDMIDFIIANPQARQGDIARRYGYTEGWVSRVMSSDAFKSATAARRAEIVDPTLLATVQERFEGITRMSLQRLQEKLEAPMVSDNVVLKAVELGAKAMGVGGNAPPPPVGNQADHLAQLANRLISLQAGVRNQHEGVLIDVETGQVS